MIWAPDIKTTWRGCGCVMISLAWNYRDIDRGTPQRYRRRKAKELRES